ncbi:MAG: adenylyltransferase/cytidyltransferase family protein, partial [Bacteroidota bacterium]
MKVFRSIDAIPSIKNPVITIGSFDGVHLGHQKILDKISGLAKEMDGNSVVITFYPHPRQVIYPK